MRTLGSVSLQAASELAVDVPTVGEDSERPGEHDEGNGDRIHLGTLGGLVWSGQGPTNNLTRSSPKSDAPPKPSPMNIDAATIRGQHPESSLWRSPRQGPVSSCYHLCAVG